MPNLRASYVPHNVNATYSVHTALDGAYSNYAMTHRPYSTIYISPSSIAVVEPFSFTPSTAVTLPFTSAAVETVEQILRRDWTTTFVTVTVPCTSSSSAKMLEAQATDEAVRAMHSVGGENAVWMDVGVGP